MNDQQLQQILAAYDLKVTTMLPVQRGYRNLSHPLILANGTRANLIVYKNEPQIATVIHSANLAGDLVAASGLPARRTLDPRIIQLQFAEHTRYASLYQYLPGQTIAWEAYTTDHLKLLGQALSHLHAVLASDSAQKIPIDNTIANHYLGIAQRMRRYFARDDVQRAMNKKLGLLMPLQTIEHAQATLRISQKLPNQQLLHMDFVRGNILFGPSDAVRDSGHLTVGKVQLTGILDFEKTGHGHPLLDIARTLAFLLVDCQYKTEAQVRKYFLYSGYDKRGPSAFRNLRQADTNLLEQLINLFLLHDFYKFLRHNPYESLPLNHHFRRTRELLLTRHLVQTTNHAKIRAS